MKALAVRRCAIDVRSVRSMRLSSAMRISGVRSLRCINSVSTVYQQCVNTLTGVSTLGVLTPLTGVSTPGLIKDFRINVKPTALRTAAEAIF